jgi:hypothetical protein
MYKYIPAKHFLLDVCNNKASTIFSFFLTLDVTKMSKYVKQSCVMYYYISKKYKANFIQGTYMDIFIKINQVCTKQKDKIVLALF